MNTLLLAYRYVQFHLGKTVVLVLAVAIMAFLPLAMKWGIDSFEKQALRRAQQTPLIVSTKTSRFAVAVNMLYFRGESLAPIKYAEVQRLEKLNYGIVIPMHSHFRSRGYPIVGTTVDYFALRSLYLTSGDGINRLGDCVLGANVAQSLGIAVGDQLLSESENLFELAGAAPLRLRVTGVLNRTGTADDDAIFCEIESTWIMEGIGHGHAFKGSSSGEHIHEASRENLNSLQEITDENLSSFHFHGNRGDYPISAIIIQPSSERSSTLLQGKYLEANQQYQVIRPIDAIIELLDMVSRVRRLLTTGLIGLMVAMLMLVALVFMLSLRIRRRELRTMFLLGCSRGKIGQIVISELALVLAAGLGLAVVTAGLVTRFSDRIMLWLFA